MNFPAIEKPSSFVKKQKQVVHDKLDNLALTILHK